MIGCVKHYAFNDQETGRTESNVIIDDRGGRESDLLAFEIGVKDAQRAVGDVLLQPAERHLGLRGPILLTQVLKTDWGFTGFVMSDWWALPSAARLDRRWTRRMPGSIRSSPTMNIFSATLSRRPWPRARCRNRGWMTWRREFCSAMFQVGVFDQPPASSLVPAMVATDEAIAQRSRSRARCC